VLTQTIVFMSITTVLRPMTGSGEPSSLLTSSRA